ncbi:MFS transporter [Sphingomonas sp.]|uniref:MFS transporter n=1 Tax=Sphingomonas sp. TaxID=28214 RepID=UPI002DD63D18|nr:MFS transporter [Sphingomonas sp.]
MLQSRTPEIGESASRIFYGWILLAVFWFILVANLAFPMTGGSLLNTAMARDLGFTREQMGLPFSVYFGVIGLSSPLVATMIGRIGIRWTLTLGNALLTLGSLAMATIVASPMAAMLCFGLVIGFAVASGGNLTAQTAIPRWFVRRRALAYAIMLTASAAGGIFIAPVLTALIGEDSSGWRSGWWVVAGFGAVATLLAATLVREAPEDVGQYADGDTAPADVADRLAVASAAALTLRQILTRSDFWTIVLASAVITGGLSLVLAHGAANALDKGHSQAAVGTGLALYALTGVLAKALVGWLGDRMNPATLWAALLVPSAMGLLVAAFAVQGPGLILYSALVGIGLGGAIVCQPATLANRFGAQGFAKAASIVFLLQAAAGVSTPTLAGWAFDPVNGYKWSFIVAALACGLAIAALLMFCRRLKS